MSKKLIAMVLAASYFSASCVSVHKNVTGQHEVRKVAAEPEVEAIAAQGRSYDFLMRNDARLFDKDDIADITTSNVKLIDGKLIKDNDASFDMKLSLIQKAKREIRMVYYIYGNDDSTSLISKALIEKAQSGVKVKLLVDFITNYKNLSLYQMLEREGQGNLKTYFYNFPGSQLIIDANYITLPCPDTEKPNHDTCFQSKMAALNAMADKNSPTAFSKIFLSGLYGKNISALKLVLGYGAEIDLADYKQPPKSPEQAKEDKEDLLELAQLAFEAFIKNSIMARIKISLALLIYGDKVAPIINELTGRLPLKSIEGNENHGLLWDHLTDYTHHKLLAIDGEEFMLGGRNLEDSYHMKERVGSKGKYIFVDTDFWGKTDRGGTDVMEASFDQMLKTTIVADLKRVLRVAPNDFIANTQRITQETLSPAGSAVAKCIIVGRVKGPSLGQCVLDTLPKMPGYVSAADRMDLELQKMKDSIERYQVKYVDTGKKIIEPSFGQLSDKDLMTAEVDYLENVNFKRDTKQRIIGSKLGSEEKNNKNIHAAWYRSLEQTCRISHKENRNMRVIIDSAYLLMPSAMIHRIARMMNNDFGDCSKVKITFITNSPETTDLGPINLLARYQLGALFDHYAGLIQYEREYSRKPGGYTRFFPTLEYYEFKKTEGVGKSLHTKVSLIGDNLIVGSANADVRSYYMDTNNAIMIRNAFDLNQQYRDNIDQLIATGKIENKINDFIGKTPATLRAENSVMLDISAKRWKQEKRLTPERRETLLNALDRVGLKITTTTKKLVTFRGQFGDIFKTRDNTNFMINKELNDLANGFDGVFKIF